MEKGYAFVMNETGQVVNRTAAVKKEDTLKVQMLDGLLLTRVSKIITESEDPRDE